MPRPTKPCAQCQRRYDKREIDLDTLSTCVHLANTYDNQFLKMHSKMPDEATRAEIAEFEQNELEYGLNRRLALDRDNGNKAQGIPASRIYESRNTKTIKALANRCGVLGRGNLRCIRTPHPDEPDRHKF